MSSGVRVAYVVRSWPRLSQTFVLDEVLGLEGMGVDISIFAMTRAREGSVQPRVSDVAAPVRYLDEEGGRLRAHVRLAVRSPWRYGATLAFALRRRSLLGGYTQSGALEAFGRAVLVADGVRARRGSGPGVRPVTHIHAHFAHDPALIALLARRLSGLPFSFTAHARDLYQIPAAALVGRAREATAVVTCCRANLDHIRGVVGDGAPGVELIYHGVDLGRFRPPPWRQDRKADPPLVVSVGRLVEKKGFDDLLRACAHLVASGRELRCEIYGEGPDLVALEALRASLGLDQVVRFCGARTQDELLAAYQRADVFALTPRVVEDGDRDGVPNVILEAMACGVPVVSTPVGGIPEVVAHDREGLLVPARDPVATAAAIEALLANGRLRRRMARAAALTAARFDRGAAALRLAALFETVGDPT